VLNFTYILQKSVMYPDDDTGTEVYDTRSEQFGAPQRKDEV